MAQPRHEDRWDVVSKDLVLTLANQEGGAHVDPALNERYEVLSKRDGLGWVAISGEGEQPFAGSAVAIAVRQITFELTQALDRERGLLA